MKSVSEAQYKKAKLLVDKVGEPAIKKIVLAMNEELQKCGVMAGCQIQWYFDLVPGKEDNKDAG